VADDEVPMNIVVNETMTQTVAVCYQEDIFIIPEIMDKVGADHIGPNTKAFIRNIINAANLEPIFSENGDVLVDIKRRTTPAFVQSTTPPRHLRLVH